MLRVKNFLNVFPEQIFFYGVLPNASCHFPKNTRISRLTCSDWVSSKTQIVRAFRIEFWKMALAETPVVTFLVFSTNTNGRSDYIT